MGVRDLWHRTLVYFGLAEDDSYYDDDEATAGQADAERTYRERTSSSVRRVDRGRSGGRRAPGEYDEIYSDEPDVVRRQRRPSSSDRDATAAATAVLRPTSSLPPREPEREPVTTAVKVHLIQPRSFNDAQQIADRFKNSIPVIINMQSAEPELAKRLIDFGSGLTYALDGGMQRIAEKVFLLTPRNVEVSAEDRARLVEQGFFNPA
jgi:cell division inhibitor SepF